MSVKTYVVDLRIEEKRRNFSPLSDFLVHHMEETLSKNEQCLLFLNKRGHSGAVLCRACGHTFRCESCDVAYTYHTDKGPRFRCHYCDTEKEVPTFCPTCGGDGLTPIGVGTQRIEQELRKKFPCKRVQRVDMDTMSTKGSYEKLLADMHSGAIDIVLGTQILAKGFDFPQVSFVGILLADLGLHIPDFRAEERMFQLLNQVHGRVSRQGQEGTVVVQTYSPEHPALQAALSGDYKSFYKNELEERKKYGFPPFAEVIKLDLVHRDEAEAYRRSKELEERLKQSAKKLELPVHVSHSPAFRFKQYSKFHYLILLRGEGARELLKEVEVPRDVRVDVEPGQLI